MSDNWSEIGVDCVRCGDQFDMVVPTDGLIAWKEGMFFQNAMPELRMNFFKELSDEERKLLISGICGKCWDKMFPKD